MRVDAAVLLDAEPRTSAPAQASSPRYSARGGWRRARRHHRPKSTLRNAQRPRISRDGSSGRAGRRSGLRRRGHSRLSWSSATVRAAGVTAIAAAGRRRLQVQTPTGSTTCHLRDFQAPFRGEQKLFRPRSTAAGTSAHVPLLPAGAERRPPSSVTPPVAHGALVQLRTQANFCWRSARWRQPRTLHRAGESGTADSAPAGCRRKGRTSRVKSFNGVSRGCGRVYAEGQPAPPGCHRALRDLLQAECYCQNEAATSTSVASGCRPHSGRTARLIYQRKAQDYTKGGTERRASPSRLELRGSNPCRHRSARWARSRSSSVCSRLATTRVRFDARPGACRLQASRSSGSGASSRTPRRRA